MAIAWYYNYYEKGIFPHQQELCDAVRWTECNLDGQSLISPTHLTGIPTNPLTLRLRSLQKALNRLDRKISDVNSAIKRIAASGMFGMKGQLHLQNSRLKTGGAAIEEISFDNDKAITIYYDKVHFALYEFFSNLGSILDRLAFEINLLYVLGNWINGKLDWLRITNPAGTFFLQLERKDKDLAHFIQAQKVYFQKVLDYRNRLIHDSIISANIDRNGFPRKFHIFLSQDPNDINSPMNVDAIEFCKKSKNDVLKLLEGSYVLILQNLHNHGNPPW
ncbi:hypothetical protein ACFLV4_03635 [Chloroflexota bacterium]